MDLNVFLNTVRTSKQFNHFYHFTDKTRSRFNPGARSFCVQVSFEGSKSSTRWSPEAMRIVW